MLEVELQMIQKQLVISVSNNITVLVQKREHLDHAFFECPNVLVDMQLIPSHPYNKGNG